MATLTAGDLTHLRDEQHATQNYLSVLVPAVLLSATVNDAAIARGARSVVYNNGVGNATKFAVIGADLTLEVDTPDGTKRARIKGIVGNSVAGTISLGENAIDWLDTLPVRIYYNYELWTIPPTIRTGIFYKDYDIAYTDQNSLPNPVAIAGPHRCAFIDPVTADITLQFDASDSYAIASGAAITGYLWTAHKNDGTTADISISNDAIADPTITFAAVGQYWVDLYVGDSNGKTQVTHRAVFIYDDANLPYTDFTVQSLQGTWASGGYRCSIQATGEVTLSDFPDYALAVLWRRGYFDLTEDYVSLIGAVADNILCVGYIRSDTDADNAMNATTEITFEITTIDGLLDNVTDFGSVSIVAAAVPGTWYEYASWLTNGRAIHHEIKWHTSLLDICDVYGLADNLLGLQYADFTEDSILRRCNKLAGNIWAKIVADRAGRLTLAEDSQMLNDAGRGALDVVFSITEEDLQPNVGLMRTPEGNAAAVDLDGFNYNGASVAPFLSICGGYRDGGVSYGMPEFRGTATQQVKGKSLVDQTDANERSGRALALANITLKEFRLQMAGDYSGAFDLNPALGWYAWGVADSELQRDLALYGLKLVCRGITEKFDSWGDAIMTEVILEPEVFGPDGIQGNYPLGYPEPVIPTPPNPSGGGSPPLPPSVLGVYLCSYGDCTTFEYYDALINVDTWAVSAPLNSSGMIDIASAGTGVLDTTKALHLYQAAEVGGVKNLRGKVLTMALNAITAGGVNTIVSNVYYGWGVNTVAVLTSTSAVVVWQAYDSGTGNTTNFAAVLTVSGTTISMGTPEALGATYTKSGDNICIAALTSSKCLAVFYQTSSRHAYAIVLDVVGNAITPGIAQSFLTIPPAAGPTEAFVVRLTDSRAIVATRYNDGTGNADYNISGYTMDVAGTIITISLEQPIWSPVTASMPDRAYLYMTRVDDTHFIINAADYNDLTTSVAFACEMVGTVITPGGEVTVAASSWATACGYKGGKVTFAYLTAPGLVKTWAIKTRTYSLAGTVLTDDANEITVDEVDGASIIQPGLYLAR